jgi:phosphoglycerate dehydrogenase-like enzyme
VWIAELEKSVAGVEFWRGKDDADPESISKSEVVFTASELADLLVHRVTYLKWVQFTRGSAFELIHPALRESPAGVSVIRGIDATQFSEFAMGCILAWGKRFPHFFKGISSTKDWAFK